MEGPVMSRSTILVGLAAVLLAASGAAQDAYKIQIRKEGKAGDRFHVSETEKSSQKLVLTDAAGKVIRNTDEQPDRTEDYEETILAKESGKRPQKLSRKYEKVLVR